MFTELDINRQKGRSYHDPHGGYNAQYDVQGQVDALKVALL